MTQTQHLRKEPVNTNYKSAAGSEFLIKQRLQKSIDNDPDLPALGQSISRIVQLSSSDDESIRRLAYFVLSDVSLTQKVLRLSNSAIFRTSSNKVVTSITNAIFLLGFNTVKTCALALLLVDGMAAKRAEHVRKELINALAASMIGRELAKYNCFKDAEEITVVALFKNIGRLLLAAYDEDRYQEMMVLINQGSHTPEQAAMEVLNFSLDTFTQDILKQWDIPASIIQGINPRSGSLKTPKSRQEWIQQAAELSEHMVPLIFPIDQDNEDHLKAQLLSRFGQPFNLDKERLDTLIIDAIKETNALGANTNLTTKKSEQLVTVNQSNIDLDNNSEKDPLNELVLENKQPESVEITQRYPSGKPYNADVLLLAGIQDVTEIMAMGNYKLNDLIMLVLETLYNSLGFRFITLCLRDTKKHQYRARSSLGKNNAHYQKNFTFPMVQSEDLFSLSMARNVDLLITDASVQKVQTLKPQWYSELLPDAHSFMVLPLVINKIPVGIFYADRELKAPEGITPEEMQLIKTLKGQVLTALNSK